MIHVYISGLRCEPLPHHGILALLAPTTASITTICLSRQKRCLDMALQCGRLGFFLRTPPSGRFGTLSSQSVLPWRFDDTHSLLLLLLLQPCIAQNSRPNQIFSKETVHSKASSPLSHLHRAPPIAKHSLDSRRTPTPVHHHRLGRRSASPPPLFDAHKNQPSPLFLCIQ
jgi:hypothetical protein